MHFLGFFGIYQNPADPVWTGIGGWLLDF